MGDSVGRASSKQDEGRVGGETGEQRQLGRGIARETHGLRSDGVVVVQLAAQQGQPLAQLQHALVVQVGRAGLDEQHSVVGQVGGEPGSHHTASRAAAVDVGVSVQSARHP